MRPGPGFWLITAWAAIDGAVFSYLAVYGVNLGTSLLLLAGLAALVAAMATARRQATPITGLLYLLVAASVVLRVVAPYRAEQPPPSLLVQGLALLAAVVLAVTAVAGRAQTRASSLAAGFASVALLGLAARAAIILTDIQPLFDVPLIQVAAGDAVLNGVDPYLTRVYHGGYPYLPLAAVGAALGRLAGDPRWSLVAGDVLTVLGIALVARRLGHARENALAAAALWAWSAAGLYIVWQGFPEPMLTGALAMGAAALVGPRPRPMVAGILLGLAAATKQFGLGGLPYLVGSRRGRTAAAAGTLVAAGIVVPVALWHPSSFLEGAVLSHIAEPGRSFALNLLVWPWGQVDVPLVVGFPVAFLVGALAAARFRGEPTAWLAGTATLFFVAFVLNRIAFVNYYALPLVVLLLLVMAVQRPLEVDSTVPTVVGRSSTV